MARLPLYLRVLTALADSGVHTVSSDTVAAATGVTSAKVRKDLSYLGSYGTRGVGYEVDVLLDCIATRLGLTEDRSVVLVGVGNLGHALAGYGGFHARGFRIVALVDADPDRVGERVGEVVVRPVDELEQVIVECAVTIGVICTPAAAAQRVCDRLVAMGVTSILNFAPTVLMVPEGVDVRKVDLAVELQILSFHEARKRPMGSADNGPPGSAQPARTAQPDTSAEPGTTIIARAAFEDDRGAQAPAEPASEVHPRTESAVEPLAAGHARQGNALPELTGSGPARVPKDEAATTEAGAVSSRPDRVRGETDGVVRVTRQAGQVRPAQVVHEVGSLRRGRTVPSTSPGEGACAAPVFTVRPGGPPMARGQFPGRALPRTSGTTLGPAGGEGA